jgi:hypothetical protein
MARAPIFRRTDQGMADWNARLQGYRGRQSRSAASNVFPHLNTNSPSTARAFNPTPRGNAAARLYPHLPSSSAARMQAPKAKPRGTRARRIYGDEY